MPLMPLISILLAFASCAASAVPKTPSCRYIPGDANWPSAGEWAKLNGTVQGRLIKTVPLGQVCYHSQPNDPYNKTACSQVGQAIINNGAQTISPDPAAIFNPYWQNQTCSPFVHQKSCELGNQAVYSININGPADVQAGLKFAKYKNVRLVVRNTGIDYQGRSAGQGSLSLWTYNLKQVNLIKDYKSSWYTGPAVKLGAGVIAGQALETVSKAGYRLVTAECGLVGMVGGYAQSGGQSQLVTAYGLGADQVLEWEVVTPRGDHVIATPEKNQDLYWALAGGGGGTYGVVLGATFRVFPEGPTAGGAMTVQTTNRTALWEAVSIWYNQAPALVAKTRDNIQLFVTNNSLTVLNFVMPDQDAASVKKLLRNYIPELDRLGLPYNLTTADYSSFKDSFVASYGPLPYGNLCPNYPIIGSRLIPRDVVLDKQSNRKLMDVFRKTVEDGTWWIGCSILNVDDAPGSARPRHPPNSVHPAWRKAIAYCNPQTHQPYDFENAQTNNALRRKLVDDIFPALEAATPGSGALNELDPTYKGDWKAAFFGSNYERLLHIKHKYDPDRLLYGPFNVGSDEMRQDGAGRLCRA